MSPAPYRCARRSSCHVGPLCLVLPVLLGIATASVFAALPTDNTPAPPEQPSLRSLLDAPLLFVKRHPYGAAEE